MNSIKVRPASLTNQETSEETRNNPPESCFQLSPTVQKFASETTLHGVRNVCDSNSSVIRRIIWLLVILACAGFCIQQFYMRILRFTSQPTSVDLDIKYNNSLTFPKVVFCNFNIINRRLADPDTYKVVNQFVQINDYSNDKFIESLDAIDNQSMAVENNYVNITELYEESGHRLSDMLYKYSIFISCLDDIRCQFRNQSCNELNFTMRFTDQGVCYEFIGDGGVLTVTNAGIGSALSMTINTEQYGYMSSLDRFTVGIAMSVQAKEDVPLMNERGIWIPVGMKTLISLDLTQVELIPLSENGCTTKQLKYFDQYSTSACRRECHSKYVVDHCGCRDVLLPGDAPTCRLSKLYSCAYPYTKNFTESKEAEECDCPPACTEYNYSPKMTFATYAQPNVDSEAKKLFGSNAFMNYVTVIDRFENSDDNQTKEDHAALVDFSPYLENYCKIASMVYPILNSLSNALSSAQQLASSEPTVSEPFIAAIVSTQQLVTELFDQTASVDPSMYLGSFLQQITTMFPNDTECLACLLLDMFGRRVAFNILRFNPVNNNNATAFLGLQNNSIALTQIINTSTGSIVQMINTRPLSPEHGRWNNVSSNISTLLLQLEETVATMQSTVHDLVENGLKPLNLYINKSVPHLSSVVLDGDFVRQNYLSVEVFFSQMRYTLIKKQTSDNLVGLICDLGGTFGLLLGASIMSLYEFVDFFLQWLGNKQTFVHL